MLSYFHIQSTITKSNRFSKTCRIPQKYYQSFRQSCANPFQTFQNKYRHLPHRTPTTPAISYHRGRFLFVWLRWAWPRSIRVASEASQQREPRASRHAGEAKRAEPPPTLFSSCPKKIFPAVPITIGRSNKPGRFAGHPSTPPVAPSAMFTPPGMFTIQYIYL